MQSFAIVPAAGRSRRMGQPKLLLPWRGSTVIETVITAWRASRVERVLMVVHPQDLGLAQVGKAAGAEVIVPEHPPAEMRDSVQIALAHARQYEPRDSDAWLLAPADMPTLAPHVIDLLLNAYVAHREKHQEVITPIWVPHCDGRRGHPVLFAWSLAAEVAQLPADRGINALVDRGPLAAVEVAETAIFSDLDTPDDYRRALEEFKS